MIASRTVRSATLSCALLALASVTALSCRRKQAPSETGASAAAVVPEATPVTAAALPAAVPAAAPAPSVTVKKDTTAPAAPTARRRTGPIFQLPTKNDALFRNDPAAFFMFVDRYGADGSVTQVWQGGSYGYVRNPRNTSSGEVFTKFHEGIDIAPMERDAAGEPLDRVVAISSGAVVFCSPNAASNYGNYVVIEHACGEDFGNFYSLYAHLKRIDTIVGAVVRTGQPIALMGHTGDGIDRRRSHVHLELCMLLSDRFSDFYAKHYKLANGNGNWHGHNLIGLDVASFLKAAREDPGITPAEFLKTAQPYYRVRVPNKTGQELEIAHRYPWLRRPGEPSVSWEISYNTAGVPLAIAPSAEACTNPVVAWVKPSAGYHSWSTRNHLGGTGSTATLQPEGARYQQLVSGDF